MFPGIKPPEPDPTKKVWRRCRACEVEWIGLVGSTCFVCDEVGVDKGAYIVWPR